jgi:hypothetical protein
MAVRMTKARNEYRICIDALSSQAARANTGISETNGQVDRTQ